MQKLKYIDLFSGCGGLSLGLYNSQLWEGVFAIEKNPDAFSTLKFNLIENNNHFDWPFWLSVESHDIKEVLKKFETQLISLRGQINLVAGGPPCQGFSTAGNRIEGDSRNDLIDSYINFIHLVQPEMLFFENVRGFTQAFKKNKTQGVKYSDYVVHKLKQGNADFSGYNVFGKLMDFSKFGIPQKRTRFILVGFSRERFPNLDAEMFFNDLQLNSEAYLLKRGLSKSQTLSDAISDLMYSSGTIQCQENTKHKMGKYSTTQSSYQQLLREGSHLENPDSHRFANHRPQTVEKLKFIIKNARKGKSISQELRDQINWKKNTVIPLSGDLPASTLTTLPDDYIHYAEPRILTVREYARIQSFSDWYEIKGKYTTGGKKRVEEVPRYSQIGNAIPPLFAEQVGDVLWKIAK